MGDNWGKYLAKPKREKEILERLAQRRYPKHMDTNQEKEQKRREDILLFWEKHGTLAAKDAFNVSRATLFRWKQDTTPKSRKHRNGYTKRVVHPLLLSEIIRLRTLYPRLGKEKLAPLLSQFCRERDISIHSEPTVGRILQDMKRQGTLPHPKTLRMSARTGLLLEKHTHKQVPKLRRGTYLPEHPGDLLQVDGVLIFTLGQRRYTFTAVDLVSRWAFSKTYKTASSRNGADFLQELLHTAPFPVQRIQTDNGSEFATEFREAAGKASLTHFHNWVKQPKYQGWIERFNRTIQEEFLDWHKTSLAGEPDQFNPLLLEWLTFYNTNRVHRSLGKYGQRLTPLAYLEATEKSH
jgi:putative transposase